MKQFKIKQRLLWLKANFYQVLPGIMAIIFLVITAGARGFREVTQTVYREYDLRRNKGYVPSVLIDLMMCTIAAIFYEVMRRKERKRLEDLVQINRQKRYAGLFEMENDFVEYLHDQGVHVRDPKRLVNYILR